MKKFGKYRLVAGLGRGGMADVTLALEQGPVGFNKLVVVKRIRDHLAAEEDFVSMLIDEARLAAKLNHPNIVNTTEVGEIEGVFYLAMEYLEGQPLSRVLRRGRKLNELPELAVQVRILADMLAGLQYAHNLTDFDGSALNVVHRDVSPSNVFVTYDGVVKVVDFGIAKAAGRITETKTGVVKGKMTYISPEQALGDPLDHRSDLFSVGVMLWEACVGERMWKGVDEIAILSKLIAEEWSRSPKEASPETPDELDQIVRKALSASPDDRFDDADQFRVALEEWLDTLPKQPSQRTVGKVVSEMFSKERTEIKELVEEQLSRIETTGPHSGASLIDISTMVASGVDSGASSTRQSPRMEVGDADSGTNISLTRVKELERARTRSMVGAGLALAAAAGVGIWFATQGDGDGDAPATATAPPPQSALPAPAPAAPPTSASAASSQATRPAASGEAKDELIELTLKARPKRARFYIDDGPRLENPFEGSRKLDGQLHVIRIEARGYISKEEEVRFDEDVELDVTLKRSAVAIRRPESEKVEEEPPSKPDPEPPPPIIPPVAKPQPTVKIDTSDPWDN